MANGPQRGAGTPAVLKDRYNIYPGQALPDYTTGTAQAFGVEDSRGLSKQLFALLVKPGIPFRAEAARILKGIESPGLMTMVDYGVVTWPTTRRKMMAVVYERPLGGRVMPDIASEFRRVEDNDLIKKAINPIAAALRELNSQGVTHRAIRPTNIFWRTAERDSVVLGDCVCSPPGYDQPMVVETIESAMCHPAARGAGTNADDLYAFGASALMLLLGRNPLATMPNPEILRSKIVEGSYQVMAGSERVPIQLIEMVKGLLSDDPRNRWTQDSLDQWLGGKRLPQVQTKIEKRAARGFTFNDRDYFYARELAAAFAANWDAAVTQISDGRLELWLRRSLDLKEAANAVALAVNSSGFVSSDKRIAGDLMLCRVCLVMDRLAPLRYRTMAVMPEGIGTLLAVIMAEGGEVRPVVELFLREAHKLWVEAREYTPEAADLDAQFREQRTFLERSSMGNGVERVLYEMNESIPCQSQYVIDDFVLEIRELLPALNGTTKRPDAKAWPIDRHVAAFIGARTSFDIERQMAEVADPNAQKSMLGMLNLLAMLQWRQGQAQLFGLTSWVGGLVQPIINSYHNRQKRRDLEKEIPKLVRQGNLIDLARLLDNAEERGRDQRGFEEAVDDWREAARQIKDIQNGLDNRDEEVAKTAQQVAALVSVGLALAAVVVLAVARL